VGQIQHPSPKPARVKRAFIQPWHILVLAILLSPFAFHCLVVEGSKPTSGQTLTENYFEHREEFAELLDMFMQDSQSERVRNSSEDVPSLILVSGSLKRYLQYRALMGRLHVKAVYHQPGLASCEVVFQFGSVGLAITGGSRAIVYRCEPPEPDRITADFDTYAHRDGHFYYVHLENSWYLRDTYS